MKHSFTLLRCWLSSAFLSLFVIPSSGQPLLTYTNVISGLDYPVDIVNAEDGTNRLFIVQQNGVIRLYKSSVLTTFMNLSGVVTFLSDERGLLSMAFHPDYDGVTNRYFFVYYTTTTSNLTTIRLVRYQTVLGNPDLGDPSTANEVLAIDKRQTNMHNHNGGKLNFGADGMLYIGVGDGGGSNDMLNSAQDGGFFLGKMLRIDINGSLAAPFYSVPPDNPYVDANDPAQEIRDEIWALGLRNPFRWSFDPLTNAMWIGDVGQGAREEVDVRMPSPTTGGVNYGWRCYEGSQTTGFSGCGPLPPANYVAPVYEYTRNNATGGYCITGGVVYRGTGSPLLYGHYIFADYISNNVWVRSTTTGLITQQPTDLAGVAGFGTDINGELFALRRGGAAGQGSLVGISSSALLPVSLLSFTGKNMSGFNELKWITSSEQNADRYIIQYSTDGNNFITAGEVTATNNASGSAYRYLHANPGTGKLYYRLLMRNLDGGSRQSSIIVIGGKNNGDIKLYPTIVSNNLLELTTGMPIEMIKITDAGGREVYRSNLNGRQGYFSIQLPRLGKGMYFVTMQSKEYSKTEKIIIQ